MWHNRRMTTTTIRSPLAPAPTWPRWAFDTLLWVLFLGPIISPLFRATGIPLVADSGVLARDLLATYICPTPQYSYMLFGLPMAVCARCWGATIGLWAARLVVGRITAGSVADAIRPGRRVADAIRPYRGLPWAARLLISAVPFLLWPAEIIGHAQGAFVAPLWLLLLNGAQAGFFAGLFFCSLWPGMWPHTPPRSAA